MCDVLSYRALCDVMTRCVMLRYDMINYVVICDVVI